MQRKKTGWAALVKKDTSEAVPSREFTLKSNNGLFDADDDSPRHYMRKINIQLGRTAPQKVRKSTRKASK